MHGMQMLESNDGTESVHGLPPSFRLSQVVSRSKHMRRIQADADPGLQPHAGKQFSQVLESMPDTIPLPRRHFQQKPDPLLRHCLERFIEPIHDSPDSSLEIGAGSGMQNKVLYSQRSAAGQVLTDRTKPVFPLWRFTGQVDEM